MVALVYIFVYSHPPQIYFSGLFSNFTPLFILFFCRCGFAGEMGPRYIIPSQVKIRTGQVRCVVVSQKKLEREAAIIYLKYVDLFEVTLKKKKKKKKKRDFFYLVLLSSCLTPQSTLAT